MELKLMKVHGSMNTFYLYEGLNRSDYGRLAEELCRLDPEADGLLAVLPSTSANAQMRVFNKDGSEASMCGNGLRCVARYVCERDGLEKAVIETMKADLKVQKQATDGGIAMYAVEISPVSFKLADLPMAYENNEEWILKPLPFISETILFTAVAVPNPHLIAIVPAELQKGGSHQRKWAEFLNGPNEYFSDGVNVSYVTKVDNGIFVKTFERGVGFTNACGTAMTASALVGCLAGLVPYGDVSVFNPGGMVKCSVKESQDGYSLRLAGNATYLSNHHFLWEEEGANSGFESSEPLEEQRQYETFIAKTSTISGQFE
ncbi:MAG TPA: diaminopimelate epimerase [Planococcus sp. (in: firmicutes)]|nr:diaminopimelate epimerase [Planococcus sp. (in: firmicutes)]